MYAQYARETEPERLFRPLFPRSSSFDRQRLHPVSELTGARLPWLVKRGARFRIDAEMPVGLRPDERRRTPTPAPEFVQVELLHGCSRDFQNSLTAGTNEFRCEIDQRAAQASGSHRDGYDGRSDILFERFRTGSAQRASCSRMPSSKRIP